MLDPKMQCGLRLITVERQRLGVECEGRCRIETVPRCEIGILNAGTVRNISCRQQAERVLPIASERLLRQIVGVVRRNSFERPSFLMERCVIVIDAGQDCRRNAEYRVLDTQTRRYRPRLQGCIVIGGEETY